MTARRKDLSAKQKMLLLDRRDKLARRIAALDQSLVHFLDLAAVWARAADDVAWEIEHHERCLAGYDRRLGLDGNDSA